MNSPIFASYQILVMKVSVYSYQSPTVKSSSMRHRVVLIVILKAAMYFPIPMASVLSSLMACPRRDQESLCCWSPRYLYFEAVKTSMIGSSTQSFQNSGSSLASFVFSMGKTLTSTSPNFLYISRDPL